MSDLVSIIMPSYNTAQYITETIQSVIDQTYHNWELIIVDDCSTDNTDIVIVPCQDKLLLYRQHGDNVVGMSNVTSITRIKSYLNNFKIIKETHIIRYNRYIELKDKMGYMFSEQQQEKLNACILFWKDLVESDKNLKRLTRIKIIKKHVKNGDFENYFNGKKGAIREFFVALFL